jgi:hypothetical protein
MKLLYNKISRFVIVAKKKKLVGVCTCEMQHFIYVTVIHKWRVRIFQIIMEPHLTFSMMNLSPLETV